VKIKDILLIIAGALAAILWWYLRKTIGEKTLKKLEEESKKEKIEV